MELCNLKNVILILRSISSKKLKKNQVKEICFLKNKEWKFGIRSQIKWFENNVKKNDLHNLLYIKSKLIGYTLLRKRTYKIKNSMRKKNYLLFDTLIIDKKYRKNKYSSVLMNFNNRIIRKKGLFSFLVCKKRLIKFYERNGWKRINRKKVELTDHKFSFYGMIFNNKKINEKYFLNITK